MTSPKKPNRSSDSMRPAFCSSLPEGRQRFLAHAIDHALAIGRRTAEDFIQHFPPTTIMAGLRHQPELRAAILVLATGIKQRIALKKSAESAADDLQIALEEGETDAESVVMLLPPDDRVRYLDHRELWQFLVRGEFWTTPPAQKEEFERAKTHLIFLLDRALDDGLITHRDVVEGVTIDELVMHMPKAELGRLIARALDSGRSDQPFRDEDLLAITTTEQLLRYVPMAHLWKSVVEPRIAIAHGYAQAPARAESIDPRSWLDALPQPDAGAGANGFDADEAYIAPVSTVGEE
jgi:hypothetical protein